MQSSKYSAEKAVNIRNRHIWEQHRPSINFSDIIEDKTVYDRIETTFGSSENDNNHEIDTDSVTVDDILGNSIVHEIRHLSQSKLGMQSNSIRASIPSRSFRGYFDEEDIGCTTAENLEKESFRPAEEMLGQMEKDENDWELSRADVPFQENESIAKESFPETPKLVHKLHGKLANMSDFSGYLVDSSVSTDLSIGRYFSNRCGDLQDIIPRSESPMKHAPLALIPTSYGQFEQADKEESRISHSKLSTSTYKKDYDETMQQDNSIASLSTIASHLDENDSDSPRTFLNKLYSKRNQKLIKENVEMLKETANQLRENRLLPLRLQQQKLNGQSSDGMLSSKDVSNSMMNSTKIEDKENQRRDSTMDTKTLDSGTSSSNVTLGSGYSPIKNKNKDSNDGNIYSNKRHRTSTASTYLDNGISCSPPTKNQSPNLQSLQSGNHMLNEAREDKRTPRYSPKPAQNSLDDLSSNMHNSNRSSTKSNGSNEAGSIRQCATDLGPPKSQRHYSSQDRSSDSMKMSLPAYGLHNVRKHNQDAISVEKRCTSQCSIHSEFTSNDGKFPLKSSTSELVWECVKLRKSVTKSLVIKNTSEKKLNLRIGVIGPGFQMSSPFDTDTLVLKGRECRECRTITITFCPTMIGKAVGKVIFRPMKSWPEETERSVYLWAYGGSTVLQLQGIERGPVGCSFLKMGETSSIASTTLERTFSIYNKGPLNGVATIFVKPKTNQCINENHISTEPNKCVIRPDGIAKIKVIYRLRRKDIERLREKSCEVLTVGTLEVIFGSEPNRQRIASILTRNGDIPSSYKQLEFLVNDFPIARMEDFKDYRESIDNVSDLFGCFRTSEIALTINRTCLDETRNADLSCIDDSVLFRTLCETPKQQSKSQTVENRRRSNDEDMWIVQPKSLSMDTQHNSRKSIVIQSFFNRVQTFQIDSNIASYFNFSTKSGKIGPNSELKINVELKKNLHIPPLNGMITIYIESGSVDIPISVQPVPYSYM